MGKWNWKSFVAGILISALICTSIPAIAAGITANKTAANVYVDGKAVTVDAYNINDYNYFKLRDFCAAVNVGVWYDNASNSIYIERDKGYDPSYTGPDTTIATATPSPTATSSANYGWEHYYKTDNYAKYTTPASENHLDGTLLTVTGTIGDSYQDNGYYSYVLISGGDKWLFTPFAGIQDNLNLNTGDNVAMYGIYQGISKKHDNLPTIYMTRMISPSGLYSARMANMETGALYEGKTVDEIRAALNNSGSQTTTPIPTLAPTPTIAPTVIPSVKLSTAKEVKDYLVSKYSTINTSVGPCKMAFTVYDRGESLYIPYDYSIDIDCSASVIMEISFGSKYTVAQRNSAKTELKQFMVMINDDLVSKIPGVKLEGAYYSSYYDYPSINVGFHSTRFATWANYDMTKSDPKSDKNYATIKATGFNWYSLFDYGWDKDVLEN